VSNLSLSQDYLDSGSYFLPKIDFLGKVNIMAKEKFYAYLTDKKRGIADNWPDCQRLVSGVPGAKYKGFLTQDEAERWLAAGADYGAKNIATKDGIYFDAGTGGGKGVEISVTDKNGQSLLDKVLPKTSLNRRGNHWIFQNTTNNYGELLACKYALQIAQKEQIKKVFGDSSLVIKYWSRGFSKEKLLTKQTLVLIKEVATLRDEFEKTGGQIEKIDGASNPADLGYHKE
jgi:ribonuclease H-related protein